MLNHTLFTVKKSLHILSSMLLITSVSGCTLDDPQDTIGATATNTAVETPETPKAITINEEESAPEPLSELIPESAPEPTPELIPESAPEPTPELIPESAPEPTPELIPESAPEPTPELIPESAPEPTPELIPESAPEPTPEREETSSAALEALEAYLMVEAAVREPINTQSFYTASLTKEDAARSKVLLWDDVKKDVALNYQSQIESQNIQWQNYNLKYEKTSLGNPDAQSRSLFISMHGGGATSASANDGQWNNQIGFAFGYAPKDALWVAPRAPTNTWNMWFQGYMDPLLDRLITNLLATENIDPNRVYLTGYSAGGDGAYQLAPRMADRWAGVQMSAGHPNGVPIENVRNLAFSLHVGGADIAFERHLEVPRYGIKLDALKQADPEGYIYEAVVHEGLPHWMGLADQIGTPFIQAHTRNPETNTVVWRRFNTQPDRSYWVAHTQPVSDQAKIVAKREGNTVRLMESEGFNDVVLYFRNTMIDFNQPVQVIAADNTVLFEGKVEHTISTIHKTMSDRQDPELSYSARIELNLP